MTVEKKIRKRIRTIEQLKGELISEIKINKQEAEALKGMTEIDGIKLIVVDDLKDRVKKDCFAYQGNKCYCLDKLYCKNQFCSFYRNDISISEIEKDIQMYYLKESS